MNTIQVAFLVDDHICPRELSRLIDVLVEDIREIRQFAVQGYGTDDPAAALDAYDAAANG
jgi:hypothetical protein